MKLLIKDDLITKVLRDNKYTVYRDGRVVSNSTGREVGYTTDSGYRCISVKCGKNCRKINIHRLVWAVYGDKPLTESLVINHKNGICTDNRIENLELVTQATNNLHRFRVLKHKAVIGNKKIEKTVADEIRQLRSVGWKYTDLCKKFKLCKSTISYIVNNKIWK